MALNVRKGELYELGQVMATAFSDPQKLQKIKPQDPSQKPLPTTGLLAIPKKRKRDHG